MMIKSRKKDFWLNFIKHCFKEKTERRKFKSDLIIDRKKREIEVTEDRIKLDKEKVESEKEI